MAGNRSLGGPREALARIGSGFLPNFTNEMGLLLGMSILANNNNLKNALYS